MSVPFWQGRFAMRDRPEIERKLKLLAEYLNELDQISQASYKKYQTDFQVKRTAERLIQLVVEVATDVNGLLSVGLGEAPPQDYFTSFTKLSQLGILPEDFADTRTDYSHPQPACPQVR
jgi:uncharacterized protein YutE (UPF0331/DUF86 family)